MSILTIQKIWKPYFWIILHYNKMEHSDMLDITIEKIKEKLLLGEFGLELESLRTDKDGYLAHTPHPFPGDSHIVRDFCENQIEINTGVEYSPQGAVEALGKYYRRIQDTLNHLPQPELLWAFSNPPYIKNEGDIPVAEFTGSESVKTSYRNYLSDRYGRYKMAFSGIHLNYSFSEELLNAAFAQSREKDYKEFKNKLYLELAQKLAAYGWIMVAATAASPLLDRSYVEKGKCGEDVFLGLASVRCSELGYWNFFTPIFDYASLASYADSIRRYIDKGMIQAPSELYYPIRLKPKGVNDLDSLVENGVNHVELRMIDCNPLAEYGLDVRDVAFAQLLICWLAATPELELNEKQQIQAVQNYKNAAHYDLKTVKIVMPDGETYSGADAALAVIQEMERFYREYPKKVQEVLRFQEKKFIDAGERYAWQIRERFRDGYVKNGVKLAESRL
ncbi:MAG: hypothetical protein NC318_14160 [Blautia sp.]|nr:hypothetical protein [Lachnoclostridium sp.]MCM1212726.1 hypothetical protein [Blautia sp.]